jgi:ribulose-5-phosphate 4-epimerase/fuculose-1-phosphate aldolase
MGEAVRGLAGKRSAVMLANHGPVVAGKDVEAACNAIEELEDTARLALLTRGMGARGLTGLRCATSSRHSTWSGTIEVFGQSRLSLDGPPAARRDPRREGRGLRRGGAALAL